MDTVTLDDFFNINFPNQPYPEVLVLDIQGAELDALQGSQKSLENAKVVVSEISRYHLYKNQGLFDDINHLLKSKGYICVCLNYDTEFEYGDAIWVKSELAKILDFAPITVMFRNKFLLLDRLKLLETALTINRWLHAKCSELRKLGSNKDNRHS